MRDKINHLNTLEKIYSIKRLSFEQGLALTLSVCEEYESLQRKRYMLYDITPANIIVDMAQLKCIAIDSGLIPKVGQEDLIADAYMFMPLESFCLTNAHEPNFSRDVYSIGLTVSRIFGSMLRIPKKFYFPRKAIERRQYIKSIQKVIKILAGVRIPNTFFSKTIGAVVLGAKDNKYQLENKLNKEKVEFFNVLYNMTGAEDKRSPLAHIIKKIRKIRYKMIVRYRKRMAIKKFTALENEYDSIFDALFMKREEIASNEKQSLLVDDIDGFLFRMTDSKPMNRPDLHELKEYYSELEYTIHAKTMSIRESNQDMNKKEKNEERSRVAYKMGITVGEALCGLSNYHP
jgi:hypothetical protein